MLQTEFLTFVMQECSLLFCIWVKRDIGSWVTCIQMENRNQNKNKVCSWALTVLHKRPFTWKHFGLIFYRHLRTVRALSCQTCRSWCSTINRVFNTFGHFSFPELTSISCETLRSHFYSTFSLGVRQPAFRWPHVSSTWRQWRRRTHF